LASVIGGRVDNRRRPKSPARCSLPRMARRGAKTARYTGATPANGARYEDTRVDRRTAFAASSVAAQQMQQALGTNGQINTSTLPNTGVICQEEMVATFCNVATGPNNAGYGTHGGAAATSTGITTPSKAIPACGEGVVPANELCN
jgi:hypothetical protein